MKKVISLILFAVVVVLFAVSCKSTHNGCPAYNSVNRHKVETIR